MNLDLGAGGLLLSASKEKGGEEERMVKRERGEGTEEEKKREKGERRGKKKSKENHMDF